MHLSTGGQTIMRNRRGFTLIELLVVIAIIAILAAILFPVFAQAKTAAKFATTLSNMKQQSLGVNLYMGDVDDTLPYAGTMNGNGASWDIGACAVELYGCPTWDKLIIPYTKNVELFSSSLDRAPKTPSNFGEVRRSFRAALNVVRSWGGITNWDGNRWNHQPLNFSAVPAPAGTILLTEQRNEDQTIGTYWAWSTYWEQWVWSAGGSNTLSNADVTVPAADEARRYYRGIDFSAAGKAAYAMADGSVRSRPRGYIFPGYARKRAWNQPVEPNLPGVCIDGDVGGPASNDCPLPQG